jgi:zinc protease
VVPAAELPLALWVAADRLGSLPALIDADQVERNPRVVLQERALRDVNAPYGLVDEQLFKRLFAAPHPLHGSVAGVPGELAQVTASDAQNFATRLLVPANGVVTMVGRFDPAEARRLVGDGLGRLPAGRRARIPPLPPFEQALVDARQDLIAREPRVTLAWRLSRVSHDEPIALRLGAQLLSFLTDGAWGMRLSAQPGGVRVRILVPALSVPVCVTSRAASNGP